MIYGISLLLFILGLVTGIPAIPHLLRMQRIKQNGANTTGLVSVVQNLSGVRMAAFLGNVQHPQVHYRTPDGKEHTLEIVDSSNFKMYRYKSGEAVEVVYNKSHPWEGYVKREWDNTLRDLRIAGGEILVAITLYYIGIAFNLPL